MLCLWVSSCGGNLGPGQPCPVNSCPSMSTTFLSMQCNRPRCFTQSRHTSCSSAVYCASFAQSEVVSCLFVVLTAEWLLQFLLTTRLCRRFRSWQKLNTRTTPVWRAVSANALPPKRAKSPPDCDDNCCLHYIVTRSLPLAFDSMLSGKAPTGGYEQ